MSANLAETIEKCVDLLVNRKGDERYREWAKGAVDRFVHRSTKGNPNAVQERADQLLARLESDHPITLVMTGGNFFSPQVIKI